jgi:hypothetical protein
MGLLPTVMLVTDDLIGFKTKGTGLQWLQMHLMLRRRQRPSTSTLRWTNASIATATIPPSPALLPHPKGQRWSFWMKHVAALGPLPQSIPLRSCAFVGFPLLCANVILVLVSELNLANNHASRRAPMSGCPIKEDIPMERWEVTFDPKRPWQRSAATIGNA